MGKKSLKVALLVVLVAFATGGACPSDTDKLADEVRNLLDSGDFTNAATKADSLVAAQNNETNRLLAASAYTGLSGINLLDMIGEFANLADDSAEDASNDFAQIACIVQLANVTDNLADLRRAIVRLDEIDGTADGSLTSSNAEAQFQMGMLQALEAFVLPTNRGATPDSANPASCLGATFTVTGGDDGTLAQISTTDTTNVLNSFVNADNHLVASGLASDDEIINVLRDNYCRLKGASAGDGFTRGELQAFVGCELASSSFVATTGVANCNVFTEAISPAITTCLANNNLILGAD